MKLSRLFSVINEASGQRPGRIVKFNYSTFKHDPKPRVFVLGRWRHPKTNNILACGINLHYLDEVEIDLLSDNLDQIMTPRTLKERYWVGRKLLPEIFEEAYRTYNQDHITEVSRESLRRKEDVSPPTQQNI